MRIRFNLNETIKEVEKADKLQAIKAKLQVIENQTTKTCPYCGGKKEWKTLCVNPECENYAS